MKRDDRAMEKAQSEIASCWERCDNAMSGGYGGEHCKVVNLDRTPRIFSWPAA
jgi:hypothetical protein